MTIGPAVIRKPRTKQVARNVLNNSAGKSKGIQYDNIPGLDEETRPVSISMWLKRLEDQDPDIGEDHHIYSDQLSGDSGFGGVYIYTLFNDNLKFGVSRDNTDSNSLFPDPTIDVNMGSWVHIVCTHVGPAQVSYPILYVGGVESSRGGAGTGFGTRTSAPGSHSIGGFEAIQDRGWGGLIAGFGRWTTVLSPAEVIMLSRGVHPLDVRPESLVICPDFQTLENLAVGGTTKRPNLIEHDGNIYSGPPRLREPKEPIYYIPEPDVRHLVVF